MALPSVTHSFTSGTTIQSSQVNTNFTDLINSLTDGTKDLTVSALTLQGALTANADITLGNNSSDSLAVNALVNSDLNPEMATGAYTLGDGTNQWQALYLDNDATDGGAVYFNGASSAFLKANAAGTQLDLDGWTLVEIDGATDSHLRLDANSGDAKITLRVDNTDATSWDILCDNSDNDALVQNFNSAEQSRLSQDGNLRVSGNVQVALDSGGTAPIANSIYEDNIIKAWGTVSGGSSPSKVDGFNFSSVSNSTITHTITLQLAMGDSNYGVVVTSLGDADQSFEVNARTTTTFEIDAVQISASGAGQVPGDYTFMVIGGQ